MASPGGARYDGPSIVHVGYVKTATTTLQNRVFGREDLGLSPGGGGETRSHLVAEFLTADAYRFDAAATAARLRTLEEARRARGLVPVWSDETLLGNPVTRTYDGHAVAARLCALPMPLKVIVSIREQRALALSAYREFVKQGGRHGLADFIGTGREPLSFTPLLRPEFLMFDRAVGYYAGRLGGENVLVLPQELLIRAPEDYAARLGAFLGVDLDLAGLARDNRSEGPAALRLMALLNRLHVRSPLSPRASSLERACRRLGRLADRLSPGALDRRLEARARAQVAARYGAGGEGLFAASNRALEAHLGYALAPYGYQ